MSEYYTCLICRRSGSSENLHGLKEFDEGWFHVPDPELQGKYGPVRDCRGRYESAVAELRPRYGYTVGTERWEKFLEDRPDYNPITSNMGNGWIGIIVNLTEMLLLEHPDLQVNQMKEKFGGLRYYTNGLNQLGHTMVSWAEYLSFNYCEVCGEPGEARADGWIKTLCEDHYADRQERREKRLREGWVHYDPELGEAIGLYPAKGGREEQ